MARVGFDLRSSALQYIPLTPTPTRICEQQPKPFPNPNPNDPNPSPYEPLLNPNPHPNPYFVYESLICQRQAICVTEVKDGGDKARVSGERNLLQQTQ